MVWVWKNFAVEATKEEPHTIQMWINAALFLYEDSVHLWVALIDKSMWFLFYYMPSKSRRYFFSLISHVYWIRNDYTKTGSKISFLEENRLRQTSKFIEFIHLILQSFLWPHAQSISSNTWIKCVYVIKCFVVTSMAWLLRIALLYLHK